ncbi:MAG: tetratricopeptide repeat protein [Pseudomonadota bacterium]
MLTFTNIRRYTVAALLMGVGFSLPAAAQQTDLDPLFERLQNVDPTDYAPLEQKIWQEWSKSGSPAMDLLLERGEAALQAEDFEAAIEHLTALTDHAPNFAQGFHARATAYYNVGKFGPALADLRRALALEPRHFGAMSGLAVILEELDMPEEALEVYHAVRAIHPHRENLSATIERLEKATAGQRL